MRVLLVTGAYPPMKCGVGDYVFRLANALADIQSIHVGVMTSVSAPLVGPREGIDILPVMSGWRFSEVLKFIGTIRAWSPDLIHIQYPTQGYTKVLLPSIIPLISFILLRKVVQTWHEVEEYNWGNLKYLLLRAFAPGEIVVVRPQYKSRLPKFLRMMLRFKRFTFIQNGSSIAKAVISAAERAAIRKKYVKQRDRLVVFFGFIYPNKGVELLFDIADPKTDRIVFVGGYDPQSKYTEGILRRANSTPWLGNVDILGFIPEEDVSGLLGVADAVVLPFRQQGGGEWNTSIHAAVSHQCFVLTTSLTAQGYDKARNIYYAKVDDIFSLKKALDLYSGIRRNVDSEIHGDEWAMIAEQHAQIYSRILKRKIA